MSTDSDMPLASATPPVAEPRARVSARARARIAGTLGDSKIGRAGATVAQDVRRAWLVAAEPPSLADWVKATKPPATVPDSPLLRVGWYFDAWVTALIFRSVSVVLFLLAGAMAYVSNHPARRVAFLLISAALITYWLLGR